MPANQCLSFLRSVYRRPCVDYEGLHNPVEQWLAAGGRYHRKRRKRISSPAEVLPCWRKGLEAEVNNAVHRDVFLFGLYTGMRRGEIQPLRWEDVDLDAGLFRVEETKTGQPLELPVTRQLEEPDRAARPDICARRDRNGVPRVRAVRSRCPNGHADGSDHPVHAGSRHLFRAFRGYLLRLKPFVALLCHKDSSPGISQYWNQPLSCC